MFKSLRSQAAARWGSAIAVVLIAGTAGQFAADGMNAVQWAGAAVAVIGSVALAVLVRVWPAPAKAPARGDRR